MDSGDLGTLTVALAKAMEGEVSIDLMDRAHATKVDLEDEKWNGRMRRLASQALQEALGQDAPEWLSSAVERAREAGVHTELVDSARDSLRRQQARQEAEDALFVGIQGASREVDASALRQAVALAEQAGACPSLLEHAQKRLAQLEACQRKTQERNQAEQRLMELMMSEKDVDNLPPALDAALRAGVCRRVLDSAWKKKASLEAQAWQAQKRELACGSATADDPLDVVNLDTHTVLPSPGRSEDLGPLATAGLPAPASSLMPPQLASPGPAVAQRQDAAPNAAPPSLDAVEPAMSGRSCPPRPAMSLSRSSVEMDMLGSRPSLQDDQQSAPRLTRQVLEALDRPPAEPTLAGGPSGGPRHSSGCASPLPELRDLGRRAAQPAPATQQKAAALFGGAATLFGGGAGGGASTDRTTATGDAGASAETDAATSAGAGDAAAAPPPPGAAASERAGGAGPLPPAPSPTSPVWGGSLADRTPGAGGLPPKPQGRRSTVSSICSLSPEVHGDDIDAVGGASQGEQAQPSARSSTKEELPSYGLDAELKARAAAKYDPRIELEAAKWIEALTGTKVIDDFHGSLRTGEVLCQLINAIKPGAIQKINAPGSPFKERENISNFLRACRALGVQEYALFSTDDLYDGVCLQSVAKCIHALGGSLCRSAPEFPGPHLGIADTSKAKRDHKRDLGVATQTGGFYGAMERPHLDLTSGQIVRGGS